MFGLLLVTKRFPAPPWLCCHVVFPTTSPFPYVCLLISSQLCPPPPGNVVLSSFSAESFSLPPVLVILNGSVEIFITLSLSPALSLH